MLNAPLKEKKIIWRKMISGRIFAAARIAKLWVIGDTGKTILKHVAVKWSSD